MPKGLEGLDLGRAGEYWRCPRLPRCFRRIACTMDRSSLPMREEQLVLQAIGQLMSIEDAADFLCIRPTASRKQAKREAKVLRADLDRFFGDLFDCPVLRRHLQQEVDWRNIGRIILGKQPIVESLWFTTAMVELAAFDLLDMALHVRAHIQVSLRIA